MLLSSCCHICQPRDSSWTQQVHERDFCSADPNWMWCVDSRSRWRTSFARWPFISPRLWRDVTARAGMLMEASSKFRRQWLFIVDSKAILQDHTTNNWVQLGKSVDDANQVIPQPWEPLIIWGGYTVLPATRQYCVDSPSLDPSRGSNRYSFQQLYTDERLSWPEQREWALCPMELCKDLVLFCLACIRICIFGSGVGRCNQSSH